MNECRICFGEDNNEDFIRPCKCSGHVHRECIKKWILSENNNSPTDCEVCLNKYSLNFAELFAEQIYRENVIINIPGDTNDEEEGKEGEGKEESEEESGEESEEESGEESEETLSIESATSEETGIINVNINHTIRQNEMSERERQVIARIVLLRISLRGKKITETLFWWILLLSLLDGFLLFIYYFICARDLGCRMEVMNVGITGTFFIFLPLLYNSYLKCDNTNTRRIIDRRISI